MYHDVPTENRHYLIAELPDRERPRERLLRDGPEALRDTELLAIVLRSGRRGRSVLQLAEDVMVAFQGDLGRLARAAPAELCAVRGIGMAKAVEIRAAFALAQRLAARHAADAPRIETPADVAALLREEVRGLRQEQFYVLLLDPKHHLLRRERVTVGLVDRSQVHAREVFRPAICESAARVVLAHNHPSGDPTPSPQDIACTRGLVEAGKLIGIEVIDHVVLGQCTLSRPRDYLSFREQNLL